MGNYKSKTINPERSHPTCQIIANLIIAIFVAFKRILKSIFVFLRTQDEVNGIFKSRWKHSFCAKEHSGTFQLNRQLKIVHHEENSQEIFISNYTNVFEIAELFFFFLINDFFAVRLFWKISHFSLVACLFSFSFVAKIIFMGKHSYLIWFCFGARIELLMKIYELFESNVR